MDIDYSRPACFGHHDDPSDHRSHVVFLRVVQNARGLEEDSGLTNHTGSGGQESFHLPTQLRLPPEVDFTLPSPGSTADSEWTDRTDLGGAPRTAPTRPVPQAVRAGPTASVPDNARPRCLAAPTSGEIRSHLTFLDEFSTPRDTDVTVACAPSASALPSGASTGSRQGRTEDEVSVHSTCGIPVHAIIVPPMGVGAFFRR